MTRLIALFALAAPLVDQHGDPLPPGAVARFGTVRFRVGSESARRSHALSPDGKYLAAEDRSGIGLWDTETGRVAKRLPWRTWQGNSPKFGLCFSPDGKFLARLAGRVVAVWDLTTGEEVFDIDYKDQDKFQGIAYLPGGKQLLVTSERESRGWVLDARTGRVVRPIEFAGVHLLLVPEGPFVVGFTDASWVLFDPETGKERIRFPAVAGADETLEVAPDGKRAWLATFTGRLRAVDTATGKTLEDHGPPARWEKHRPRLAVGPDGARVYLGQADQAVHRWDAAAGRRLPPIPGTPVGRLLPHPDGKRLLVLGDDGVLRRYDLATLKELPGPDGFDDRLFAFPSPDGRRVAVESGRIPERCRLDVFEVGGRRVWTSRFPAACEMPRWTPDGRRLACIGPTTITLHDAATGRVEHTWRTRHSAQVFTDGFIPAPGDRLVAPVTDGEELAVFDLKTGERAAVIRMGVRGPLELAPDGRTAVFTPGEGGLRLFDLAAGRWAAEWPGPMNDRRRAPPHPRFSPNGLYLLTWETVRAREPTWAAKTMAVLRDPVTLERRREFEADEPSALAFSPEGLWLAIGRDSGKWSLWDIPTGERLGVWDGHRDEVTSIAFAGPGRVLTGSRDLTALLWDPRPKAKPTRPLWEALSGKDADEVYRAVWALAADPTGPDLLRAKVTVVPAVPAEKVRQWIADLGADRFAVREAATKGLRDLGRLAEPDLRAARAAAAAEEVRSRIDALLAKVPRERTGAEVVQARAVLALELAGTDAAKRVLTEWASGPAGARLAVDAKAALGRLAAGR